MQIIRNGFQEGDFVKAFGVEGQIISIDINDIRPIKVKFENLELIECFYLDGRLSFWHKLPCLTIIGRPPKTVKLSELL